MRLGNKKWLESHCVALLDMKGGRDSRWIVSSDLKALMLSDENLNCQLLPLCLLVLLFTMWNHLCTGDVSFRDESRHRKGLLGDECCCLYPKG